MDGRAGTPQSVYKVNNIEMVFETSAGQEISHLHEVSTPGLVTT